MTNHDLLTQVSQGVGVLVHGTTEEAPFDFPGAQTTRVRYAVKENRDRLQDCMERYREMLTDIANEHEVEEEALLTATQKVEEGVPAEQVTDEFCDDVEERFKDLLETDTPFEAYTVPDSAIFKEPSVPMPVLDHIDWMIEN